MTLDPKDAARICFPCRCKLATQDKAQDVCYVQGLQVPLLHAGHVKWCPLRRTRTLPSMVVRKRPAEAAVGPAAAAAPEREEDFPRGGGGALSALARRQARSSLLNLIK